MLLFMNKRHYNEFLKQFHFSFFFFYFWKKFYLQLLRISIVKPQSLIDAQEECVSAL